MKGMILMMLMALSVVAVQAQENRELTRQEKKRYRHVRIVCSISKRNRLSITGLLPWKPIR